MPARQQPIRQYPQATTLSCGPFIGVCDSVDPTTAQPNKARQSVNGYRKFGPQGSAFIGRPGTELLFGSWGTVVQAAPSYWTTFAGTLLNVGVADGKVITYDFDTNTITTVLSATDITGAGGTLSATNRCQMVPFADGLIFNDREHRMLFWDGTPHGGLTVLTNAPIAWWIWVFAGTLFVIDLATQRTMYWSEPGQPNVGYVATVGEFTYANAWDNPGGYTEPMTVGIGTNEANYLYRARVALAITGAVASDYATAHTRANLSPLFGTNSPFAVVETPLGILAPDASGQPRLFHYGQSQPLDLSNDCAEQIRLVPHLALPDALVSIDQETFTVAVILPQPSDSYPTAWLVFSLENLQYQGTWNYQGAVSSVGVIVDALGVRRVVHSEAVGGRVVCHGTPVDGPWIDIVQGMVSGIAHTGTGPFQAWDPEVEQLTMRMEVATAAPSTSFGFGYETSRGASALLYQPVGIVGGSSLWGAFVWGVDQWGGTLGSGGKIVVGIAGRGRYFSVVWDHSVPGEQFGVTAFRVTGAFTQGNPKAA